MAKSDQNYFDVTGWPYIIKPIIRLLIRQKTKGNQLFEGVCMNYLTILWQLVCVYVYYIHTYMGVYKYMHANIHKHTQTDNACLLTYTKMDISMNK